MTDKKISQLNEQTSLTDTDELVFQRSGTAQKISYANMVDSLESELGTAVHTHAISDVTGLQTALDGKADTLHTHVIGQTTGLQTALDGKAATVHSHAISDTTGLQAALDGKAANGHTHLSADISDLETTLDSKADVVHTHVISDTTGLQAALNNKTNLGHTHLAADITDLATYVGNVTLSGTETLSNKTLSAPKFDPYVVILKSTGGPQGTIEWPEWAHSYRFYLPKINADSSIMVLQGKTPGGGVTAVAGSVPYCSGNLGVEGSYAGCMELLEGGASVGNKFVGWNAGGTALEAKDAPAGTGTVTSIGVSAPTTIFTSSADITTSGDVTLSYATGQATNRVIGTDGSGNVGLIALTASHIPNIAESQVTNLVSDLAGKASTTHTHAASDITSGQLSGARGGTGADLSAAATGGIPYFSSAGVMSALAKTNNFLVGWNGSGTPVAVDPATVGGTDINGMTALTAPSLNDDYIPVYDTSATANRKTRLLDFLTCANIARIETECVNIGTTTDDFCPSFAGTSSTAAVGTTTAGHPGVVLVSMGTSASAYSGQLTSVTCVRLGGGKVRFSAVFSITNLSDATDTYVIRAGLLNVKDANTASNGVYATYTHGTNTGKWQMLTTASGITTTVNGGTTVTAAYHRVDININAAGTSCELFVDGVSQGTSASNIPTGSVMYAGVQLYRTGGTTNVRTLSVDYIGVLHELSR